MSSFSKLEYGIYPNNKACKANAANRASQKANRKRGKEWDLGFIEGESYSRFDENRFN